MVSPCRAGWTGGELPAGSAWLSACPGGHVIGAALAPGDARLTGVDMRGWTYRYAGPADLLTLVRPGREGRSIRSPADLTQWLSAWTEERAVNEISLRLEELQAPSTPWLCQFMRESFVVGSGSRSGTTDMINVSEFDVAGRCTLPRVGGSVGS